VNELDLLVQGYNVAKDSIPNVLFYELRHQNIVLWMQLEFVKWPAHIGVSMGEDEGGEMPCGDDTSQIAQNFTRRSSQSSSDQIICRWVIRSHSQSLEVGKYLGSFYTVSTHARYTSSGWDFYRIGIPIHNACFKSDLDGIMSSHELDLMKEQFFARSSMLDCSVHSFS